jgi:hypothetical protein
MKWCVLLALLGFVSGTHANDSAEQLCAAEIEKFLGNNETVNVIGAAAKKRDGVSYVTIEYSTGSNPPIKAKCVVDTLGQASLLF